MNFQEIATWDLVLSGLLILAMWRGFRKGLIVEVASLVALIAGVFAGFHGSDGLAIWLNEELDWPEEILALTAFILAFILVVIGVHLLAKMIEKMIDATGMGLLNKAAGSIFGLAKMACLISIVFFALDGVFGQRQWMPKDAADHSLLYPHVESIITHIVPEMERDTSWETVRKSLENDAQQLEDRAKDVMGNWGD